MNGRLNIPRLDEDQLVRLVARQLENFIPDGLTANLVLIRQHLPQALERLRGCINSVCIWRENEFDHLQSSQYCIFIYFLANTIWKETANTELPTKLFILNKALNGIDLFYEIEMPSKFFIGHSVGIVFAKANYSDYLAVYQNSTVGKNHGVAPEFESGVVMYPNTAVIGRSLIKSGTILAQNTRIINRNTPGECIAFNTVGNDLVFKAIGQTILQDIFRI
jgi:serine O-acetyltransferase